MLNVLDDLLGVGVSPEAAKYLASVAYAPAKTESEMAEINARGSGGLLIERAIILTGNRTLSVPVFISKSGAINLGGYTLTITGSFSAGRYQCFSNGSVIFGDGSTGAVFPEWFGAVGDGTTNDTTAIAAALSAASSKYIPVEFAQNKTYRISQLTLPERATLYSPGSVNGAAALKATGASAMLVCPAGETYVRIRNLRLDGNSTAAACIDVNGAQYLEVTQCLLRVATVGIDQSDGYVVNRFYSNRFSSCGTGILLSGVSSGTIIKENHFSGTYSYGVYADANNAADSIEIHDNVFEGTNVIDFIRLEAVAGYAGKLATVERNRFDGASTGAHVRIGQRGTGIIAHNSFAGANLNLVIIDGTGVAVINNFFSQSTGAAISLTANSSLCRVYDQTWGSGPDACASEFSDAGTNNRRTRTVTKDTTVNRPTLTTADIGQLYLDTTLDADGLPVFWQGSKWIKADGTNA